ncbi:MAG: hypothetical protein JOY62_16530 [Acidobacteriaceae bacterium]|nr:hypothetical protein [Acidobacteriaceae bacterium]MBV9781571.1 hypothetical protein [Acidobacteriaceae bacterium]
MALFGLSAFCAASAFGQRFSFGVVAGGSLTSDFVDQTVEDIRTYPTAKDYIVGPTFAVTLPATFSIEVDALYRPMHYTFAVVLPDGTLGSVSPATVITWEVPVLAQYKFRESGVPIRPLLELGPSFRVSGNLNGSSPSTYGITSGAGIEAHFWKLRVAPQLRYTRWAADHVDLPWDPRTKQSQLELLVGLSF